MVSVLVVTWNNRDTIDDCLASLPDEGVEVLVWDNASVDGTPDLAERHRALVIRSPQNVGFAPAVNALARHATGDSLLLLNPDTRLDASAVAALERASGGSAIAGAELRGRDGCVQPASGRAFPSPWTLLRPVFLRRSAGASVPSARAEVDAVSGACMLVPAPLWRKLGGLDEGYPHSGEDLDLCLRARRAGARVVYEPAARAFHEHEASVRQAPAEIDVLRWAGAVRFVRRHRGGRAALFVRAALALHAAVVVAASYAGYRRSARSIRRARLVLRWATRGALPELPAAPEAAA